MLVRDGLRLHYRDYPGSGDKPPLLCLPGLTRNARDFAAFAELHSPEFRVLVLEFRGRGESEYDPVPARYVPLTYAGDVLEFLDQLSIPQAIFVGTSLGGLVTMTVAAISPDRIAAAILNDVGPDLSKEGLDRIRSYVGKDLRFASWDEAADVIAQNNNHVPASFRHADWVRMAHRVCREKDGEIVFDYDLAIAEPFNTAGADAAVRHVALVRRARAKAASRDPRGKERPADRGCGGKDARRRSESEVRDRSQASATRPSSTSPKRSRQLTSFLGSLTV